MPGAFEVTLTSSSISLDDGRRGEYGVTVHNRSGAPQRGTLTAVMDRNLVGAKTPMLEWLTIPDADRHFAVNETQQYAIRVAVPADAEAGTYGFRPVVRAERNPDEQSTVGPLLTFDVAPAKPPPTPFPWWTVAAIAGVLLVVGAVAAFFLLRFAPVPDVVGSSLGEAERVLDEADFAVGSITARSTLDAPDGTVLEQDPGPGDRALRGSAVDVVVERNVVVPNVVGQSFASAQNALANAGLEVGSRTERSTLGVSDGVVLEQDPDADALAAPGSAVDLVVERNVVVPNVRGQSLTAARAALTSAGLRAGSVTEETTLQANNGTVLSQSPRDGVRAAPNAAVDLVVERNVMVPNTVGTNVVDARTTLEQAGLQVGGITTQLSAQPLGTVLSQTPAANTVVAPGATVNLVIARELLEDPCPRLLPGTECP